MKRKLNYTPFDAGMSFLSVIIVQQLLVGVAIFFVTIIFRIVSGEISNTATNMVNILFSQLSFGLVWFLISFIKRKNYVAAPKLRPKMSWINYVLCAVIAVIIIFASMNLIENVNMFLENIGYKLSTDLPLPMTNGWWLVANLFFLAVLPAIFEELLFRGVVLNGFMPLGKNKAIVLSALMFMLMHGSAQQTVYQFLLGIILAFVVVKTGSIICSMVVHFINNALVIIFEYVGLDFIFTKYNVGWFFLSLAVAAAGVAVIYFLAKFFKKSKLPFNEKENLVFSQDGNIIIDEISQDQIKYIDIENGRHEKIKMTKYDKLVFFGGIGLSLVIWISVTITKIL